MDNERIAGGGWWRLARLAAAAALVLLLAPARPAGAQERLSLDEMEALNRVCEQDRARDPWTGNLCRERELRALAAVPRPPGLDRISFDEQLRLNAKCAQDQEFGPAELRRCQARELAAAAAPPEPEPARDAEVAAEPAPARAPPTEPRPAPTIARPAVRTRPAALDPGLVREAQRLLSDLGHYSGGIDGVPGPGTERAIRTFEAATDRPPTGVPTPGLLAALRAAARVEPKVAALPAPNRPAQTPPPGASRPEPRTAPATTEARLPKAPPPAPVEAAPSPRPSVAPPTVPERAPPPPPVAPEIRPPAPPPAEPAREEAGAPVVASAALIPALAAALAVLLFPVALSVTIAARSRRRRDTIAGEPLATDVPRPDTVLPPDEIEGGLDVAPGRPARPAPPRKAVATGSTIHEGIPFPPIQGAIERPEPEPADPVPPPVASGVADAYAGLFPPSYPPAPPQRERELAEGPPPEYLPPPVSPRDDAVNGSGVPIDLGALEAKRRETAMATELVRAATSDEAPLAPTPPVGAADLGPHPGLKPAHARLRRILAGRPEWPRAEFEAAARGLGLTPDGAFETLNDWALDALGDLLLEGDDPVTVNRDLVAVEADELV